MTLLGPRAYDPVVGRFLQRDPIAVLARSTTANPYAFAFNDPVNYADPSGLTPCSENPTGLCGTLAGTAAVSVGFAMLPWMLSMLGHAPLVQLRVVWR